MELGSKTATTSTSLAVLVRIPTEMPPANPALFIEGAVDVPAMRTAGAISRCAESWPTPPNDWSSSKLAFDAGRGMGVPAPRAASIRSHDHHRPMQVIPPPVHTGGRSLEPSFNEVTRRRGIRPLANF